jgi:hypothetical protein
MNDGSPFKVGPQRNSLRGARTAGAPAQVAPTSHQAALAALKVALETLGDAFKPLPRKSLSLHSVNPVLTRFRDELETLEKLQPRRTRAAS